MNTTCARCQQPCSVTYIAEPCKKTCSTVYCYRCMPYGYGIERIKCHICWIKSDKKAITKALAISPLSNALSPWIYKCITQFSRGYVVYCCNSDCSAEIFIDNTWELYAALREPFRETDFYAYHVKYIDSKKHTITIKGSVYRIFCKHCYLFVLKQCGLCYKYDLVMELREVRRYYNENFKILLCTQHPKCGLCNQRACNQRTTKLPKCYYCKTRYCNLCGIHKLKLCRNCVIQEEYQWIYDAISRSTENNETMIGSDIIAIITQYAMGYALDCCVWDCEDEISVENRWELWLNMNHKDNYCVSDQIPKNDKYSWYYIGKQQRESDIYNVYDMRIRVFCKYCTDNVCVDCWKCFNNKDAEIVCKNHLYCIQCGIRARGDWSVIIKECSFCKEEKAYCMWCSDIHLKKEHSLQQRLSLLVDGGYLLNGTWIEMYDDQYVFSKACKPYRLSRGLKQAETIGFS